MQAGFTRSGPHRTDVGFYVEGREASKILSRGQTKLFIVLLIVGQAIEFIKKNKNYPIMLVDDIATELDKSGLDRALSCLLSLKLQLFINSMLPEAMDNIKKSPAMFHVEHGEVTKMVE